MDPQAGLRRGERIAAHTSFFKTGVCIGKTIVCVVKTSALSTTVKTFEPVDENIRNKSKPTFRRLLHGGNDTLKLFKVSCLVPIRTEYLSEQLLGVLYSGRNLFSDSPEIAPLYWLCTRLPDRQP
jgi:hypothetical protein